MSHSRHETRVVPDQVFTLAPATNLEVRSSRGTYGSPWVWGQLRRNGVRGSRKRVERIMAECGLVGAHSRRRWRRGRPNTAPAPDLLDRDFTAAASNERWVGDITEFACVDGKLLSPNRSAILSRW